ncbi:MarR family winged helix-turn-helix transcriptional regulator [Croceicoccus mobilis]|uniref:MarR family transcriptional regulator n=1 Tax=Croceicoccus mobilis TaxID=1703339 RepID=A0A916Z2F7_9SPHN|nr:MarR family transcriptional regulator [Croceicoccus mobilis]GGD72555.1 MarR family transcriptional regulator [Croceicoccus mobilis]
MQSGGAIQTGDAPDHSGGRGSSGGTPRPNEDLRLWVRLLSCAKVIEKRLRRNFADEFDTTLPRFDVMAALDRAGEPLSMSALSQALLVSGGNVTHVVRQLVTDGLVETAPSPDDARSALVSLTAEGSALFADLAAAHQRWVTQSLGTMPPESRSALLTLLSELRGQLDR